MDFKRVVAPNGATFFIPADINLVFPKSNLPGDLARFLAYIPWDNKYLKYVPPEYKAFFEVVLPHLHKRTTDVHTAICLSLLKKILEHEPKELNRRLIYISLILHDCGWSLCSEKEIADSLSYMGAIPTSAESRGPKNKHADLGSILAKEILNNFKFNPLLSEADKETVAKMVLYHDVSKEQIDEGVVTKELYLVSDADRLWSYTHENFWQDTVRKGVPADEYANNLDNELDGYFYTEQGKQIARNLLSQRREEVTRWATLH